MTGKLTTTLRGTLLTPLSVGSCVYLSTGGRVIRTSRVVAIQSRKHNEIRFETLNTHYRLLLNTFPHAVGKANVFMAA